MVRKRTLNEELEACKAERAKAKASLREAKADIKAHVERIDELVAERDAAVAAAVRADDARVEAEASVPATYEDPIGAAVDFLDEQVPHPQRDQLLASLRDYQRTCVLAATGKNPIA